MRHDDSSGSVRASCSLCEAVDSISGDTVRPVYNTHLLETERFVVIPAVGPLVAGHVMVVSRAHYPNLGAMPREAVTEYKALVAQVFARAGATWSGAIEAEHGSTETQRGGACITHVHINVLPGLASHVDMFDGRLPVLAVRHDLTDLTVASAPYILLRTESKVRLYSADGVPSQLIRQRLSELAGRDDWDWAAFPNLPIVEQTIELWHRSA